MKYASRKFLIALLSIAIVSVMVQIHTISESIFRDLFVVILGYYGTSNVIEKIKGTQ